MLFTPDERRALITLGGLLTLGLAVRLLAPGPPPPEGGGDSLLVVIAAILTAIGPAAAQNPRRSRRRKLRAPRTFTSSATAVTNRCSS